MSVAEHGTEGGFGTGLRRKLQGDTPEPRSPGEAIAASPPQIIETSELEMLRAELNASLAREQDLRLSLSDQMDTSGRDVRRLPPPTRRCALPRGRAPSRAS